MSDETKGSVRPSQHDNYNTYMYMFPSQVIQAAQDHISLVSGERAYYKTACKNSSTALKSIY